MSSLLAASFSLRMFCLSVARSFSASLQDSHIFHPDVFKKTRGMERRVGLSREAKIYANEENRVHPAT
jgi:hypothetical protein